MGQLYWNSRKIKKPFNWYSYHKIWFSWPVFILNLLILIIINQIWSSKIKIQYISKHYQGQNLITVGIWKILRLLRRIIPNSESKGWSKNRIYYYYYQKNSWDWSYLQSQPLVSCMIFLVPIQFTQLDGTHHWVGSLSIQPNFLIRGCYVLVLRR